MNNLLVYFLGIITPPVIIITALTIEWLWRKRGYKFKGTEIEKRLR